MLWLVSFCEHLAGCPVSRFAERFLNAANYYYYYFLNRKLCSTYIAGSVRNGYIFNSAASPVFVSRISISYTSMRVYMVCQSYESYFFLHYIGTVCDLR